ncbi:hypothetical protein [Hydrogenophaga sp.]|uniref:hypothetical protein n=1 Tax=Hydrogenophaga sp. TaxID=1904254 RepID=UPI0025C1F600|nr:hypothetical protein [Hydrogenophaga sp.]
MSTPAFDPVPDRYHGVWTRTLLETPEGRDTTTWVRWLQTSQWHADLRVPVNLDRAEATGLAQQQGFCGVTEITPALGDQPEICTWHRQVDLQPARSTPDAGHMVFEGSHRVIETGIHGRYLEVWERLPDSVGRQLVLLGLDAAGELTNERILISGSHLVRVRPRRTAWPEDTLPDEDLATVLARHPLLTGPLLAMEISFGRLKDSIWTIECSSLPLLEHQVFPFHFELGVQGEAVVAFGEEMPTPWRVASQSGIEP